MELLSPAGNSDALRAAISCGADAVYLGYTAFGARSYAGNFDETALFAAMDYAHERGKKIYVTVNTLVKQAETDDLADVLELLSRCGADAILVQDLGAARIAKTQFPNLTLHASTQMTVNNAQGARLMQRYGFERVVPARECSLSELRKMADTGVEVEAFAHGALCVAVSGQCLFSSLIGGRSGNRGRCAQPCRLPYGLDDGTSGYLLSTKDLMLIDHLPELRDAGVYSFKLEGRMKRPEYVGVITRAYRQALDAAEAHVPYHPDGRTIEGLRQIFNRGGFTEGYAMGRSNAALMSWERPNHWGVKMGRVLSVRGQLAQIQLEKNLNDGDGLQLRGKSELDTTYSGKDTPAGAQATLRLPGAGAKPGDMIYRLTDAVQMKEIRAEIEREKPCVQLEGILKAVPGELPVLTLRDQDGHTAQAVGAQPVDAAQQRAMTEESAMKQLAKMGGTPYALEKLTLLGENAFMPAGALNALRRDALDGLRAMRTARPEKTDRESASEIPLPEGKRLLIAQGERLEDAAVLLSAGADAFYWMPQDMRPASLERALLANPDVSPVLVLPAVTYTDELTALSTFVRSHGDRISGVVVSNIGQLESDWGVPVIGGQGLNVMNRQCAMFFAEQGVGRMSASCELSAKELSELAANDGDFEIEAYGRTQLMLLSHCPRRTKAGDTVQDSACARCERDGGCPAVYTDRKGYRFPARRLKMPHGCVVRLYNSVVTDMSKASGKLLGTHCSLRLCFTDETVKRQEEIVRSYRSLLDTGRALHEPAEQATAGHLLRGIE